MTLTAGTISLVQNSPTAPQLAVTAATGGIGPYTYQWYKSTTSGFSPGGGNLISGATALTLTDTGDIPGTAYYYKVISTDTGNSNATVTSAQFANTTLFQQLNPNQFAQAPYLGALDLRFDYDTVSVLIDVSQPAGSPLVAGAAVKLVDSANGDPKVIGCTADSDEVFGFIVFQQKTVQYVAGVAATVSLKGNCQYLFATEAIARGAKVSLDLTTMGGVKAAADGTSNDCIVGWAYDKAVNPGDLIRVMIETPYFGRV